MTWRWDPAAPKDGAGSKFLKQAANTDCFFETNTEGRHARGHHQHKRPLPLCLVCLISIPQASRRVVQRNHRRPRPANPQDRGVRRQSKFLLSNETTAAALSPARGSVHFWLDAKREGVGCAGNLSYLYSWEVLVRGSSF